MCHSIETVFLFTNLTKYKLQAYNPARYQRLVLRIWLRRTLIRSNMHLLTLYMIGFTLSVPSDLSNYGLNVHQAYKKLV